MSSFVLSYLLAYNADHASNREIKAFQTCLISAIELGLESKWHEREQFKEMPFSIYIDNFRLINLSFPKQIGKSYLIREFEKSLEQVGLDIDDNPDPILFIHDQLPDNFSSLMRDSKVVVVDSPDSNIWLKIKEACIRIKDQHNLINSEFPMFVVVGQVKHCVSTN